MKKTLTLIFLYLFIFIQSCICPQNEWSITYITIESVRSLFFSFDENGIFPELESYDRTELGIGIYEDSISRRIETASLYSPLMNSSFACEDPDETDYLNYIDSLYVVTKYNFDQDHPAGSIINELLDPLDIMGEITSNVKIEELTLINGYFKFNAIPQFDSMQFIINGRISEKGSFTTQTELIVLPD